MAKMISFTNFLSVIERFTIYPKSQPVVIGGGSTTMTRDKRGRTCQIIVKPTAYGERKCERWSVSNTRTFCPRRWTRNRYWTREWGDMTTLW